VIFLQSSDIISSKAILAKISIFSSFISIGKSSGVIFFHISD
jgi:hypothetical protein